MSTSQNEQRSTPETDKAIGRWNPELHEVVTAFFARKLERERDEEREQIKAILNRLIACGAELEAMRKTLIESEAYQAGLTADIEAMREAIKGAYEALEEADGSTYHIEGDACLTKSAKQQRESALAKLQPFINP